MAAPVGFALLDGNNFYCACERVFDPRLARRPLVVLSNNDGCAIARSEEAKALGIRMGAPWFQLRPLQATAGLIARSANFELYGDLSDRMMRLAEPLGVLQEIYSIDECFLSLDRRDTLTARAWATRSAIRQGIGIPTGIGLGATKTLAKLANHIAKTADRQPGRYPPALARVCNLLELDPAQQAALFQRIDVAEVWGIGPQLGQRLKALGIATVHGLQGLDPARARQLGSVVLERTVRELNGTACLDLEDSTPPRQTLACTRSFGQPVTALADLRAAIASFASRAAEKLRAQHSVAGQIQVFIHTSPFRPQDRPYAGTRTLTLDRPTQDTLSLSQTALRGLQQLYRPGYRYAKAGVLLLDLYTVRQEQQELAFDEPAETRAVRNGRLMQTLDAINQRYGQGTLQLGVAGLPPAEGPGRRPWQMRQEHRSPRMTTRWDELLVVKA